MPSDLEPAWNRDVGKAAAGPVGIGDSVVVSVSSDRRIMLLRRATGDIVWRSRLSGPGSAGALFDENHVYAASGNRDGSVSAYDFERGKRRWSRTLGPVVGPLAAFADDVYAATAAGRLVALDATDGRVRWERRFQRPLRAGVTVLGSQLVVATDDSLYLLARVSGQRIASVGTEGAIHRPPAVVGSLLIANSPDGLVSAFDTRTLRIQWEVPLSEPVFGNPAIARDTVFVVTLDGGLWRIPLDDPSATRRQDLGLAVRAPPMPVENGVLIGTISGEILWVPQTGAPTVVDRVAGPIEHAPMLHDGMLLVVDGNGEIHTWTAANGTRTEP
jgi:outer membrane protein assembly factor BamB